MRPEWAPTSIDIERPSAARMYDYVLGGSHNFAADRALADQIVAALPDMPLLAQANRAFLRRAVQFLAAQGVRQFLDIGSGIPTRGNVHDIAEQAAPDARTIYVDFDPVAVAHSRALLAGNDRTGIIEADLRKPGAILGHPVLTDMLDLTRPVGLLLVAVLHFIGDQDQPHAVVARLTEALPSGSYLVITHLTADDRAEDVGEAQQLTAQAAGPSGTPRGYRDVLRFFDGFELVEPGLTWASEWRPDSASGTPLRSVIYGGVGRKA
jgi:SAM-dependent methyltransferase